MAAGDPGTELAVKTLTEDSTLYHFGNYLSKIGKHVALDLGEALDWATEKLRGETLDDQDAAEQGPGCAAPADRGAAASGGESAMIAQKKKILILMSDTGGGHRASANAIKAALLSLEPEQLEVKIVDVLEDYTLWFSNRLYTWYIKYPVRLAVLVHALVFFHTHTHTHTRTHTHAHTHTRKLVAHSRATGSMGNHLQDDKVDRGKTLAARLRGPVDARNMDSAVGLPAMHCSRAAGPSNLCAPHLAVHSSGQFHAQKAAQAHPLSNMRHRPW